MVDVMHGQIDRRSLREHLEEKLRDMIVSGDLAPGQKISEKQLCDTFEVSRTPLREALRTMASEGFVELRNNRGAIVTPLRVDELDEIFPVLAVLEALAGETACAANRPGVLDRLAALQDQMETAHAKQDLRTYFQVNQAIHHLFLQAAGNPVLEQIVQNLTLRAQRMRFRANLAPERWKAAVDEHRGILEAFQARRPDEVSHLLRAHIQNKSDALRRALMGL